MSFVTCGWLWIYSGALLMLLELVVPGFVLCFFGLSAISVGALRFVFGEGFSTAWQFAAFSVLSVVYIVVLRRYFKQALMGDKSGESTDLSGEYVGRSGRITEAVKPPMTGRVMIGDAEWTASADSEIAVGTDVRVVSQTNLTMKVEVV